MLSLDHVAAIKKILSLRLPYTPASSSPAALSRFKLCRNVVRECGIKLRKDVTAGSGLNRLKH
jgi:hypothetical protein